MEIRLQMRWLFSVGFWQYRFVRDNGAGGKWKNTEYLAWLEWRRFLKAA